MLHILENEHLKLTLSNYGGEIHSIKSKKDNVEYLWNGDAAYWKYHAPVLFPIVGKVVDSTYRVGSSTYELPQHGLARVREFETFETTSNSISFQLTYSEETLKIYPYKFSLIIKYTLKDTSVMIEYFVKNLDNDTIFFSIGAHTAFMCPILENESLNDYYFEFSEKETANIMCLNTSGYFKRDEVPYLNNDNIINCSLELFKNDALVFNSLKSNKVYLKSNKNSKSIEFDFTGFPYLALWSKPEGAPFICIEPWFGHADFEDFTGDFREKAGIEKLDINKTFNCCHTITIN